jgi:hypothetical protein
MKKITLFILLMFVGSVSAELNGYCKGNILFWTNRFGKDLNRDCSVLHTNSGRMYRGECREYAGGAACYKIGGEVSHEYIKESRHNASIILATTTTTIPVPIVNLECPSCPECPECTPCIEAEICDYSAYIENIEVVNYTLKKCYDDLDYYKKEYKARVPKAYIDDISMQCDNKTAILRKEIDGLKSDIEYIEDWNSYYKGIAIFSFLIVLFIIYVWVKKPSWEEKDEDIKL